MKHLLVGLSFLSALACSVTSQAAPVLYQFQSTGGGTVTSNNAALLIALGATDVTGRGPFSATMFELGINGSFVFDNSKNQLGPIPFEWFGLGSGYERAAIDFNGTALGVSFQSDYRGAVSVANNVPLGGLDQPPWLDSVRAMGGVFQGQQRDVFILDAVSISWQQFSLFALPLLVTDSSLPSALIDLNAAPQLELRFKNAEGSFAFISTQNFILTATPVPVPPALPLMFSALVGLFGLRHWRKK